MPWSGGFLSWPAYHYTRLRVARTIRAILLNYKKADNPVQWTEDNPEQFRLVAIIERERRRIKANGNNS